MTSNFTLGQHDWVANNMRTIRMYYSMTTSQMAVGCQVSRSNYLNWENGKMQPSLAHLKKIEEFLKSMGFMPPEVHWSTWTIDEATAAKNELMSYQREPGILRRLMHCMGLTDGAFRRWSEATSTPRLTTMILLEKYMKNPSPPREGPIKPSKVRAYIPSANGNGKNTLEVEDVQSRTGMTDLELARVLNRTLFGLAKLKDRTSVLTTSDQAVLHNLVNSMSEA